MSQELQFLVMANTQLNLEDFTLKLKQHLRNTTPVKPQSFDFSKNWVQIDYNEDYDEHLSKNDEDAFLYYKYRIEVSPVKEVTLDEQIQLAKKFIEVIQNLNGDVEICSTFEDRL